MPQDIIINLQVTLVHQPVLLAIQRIVILKAAISVILNALLACINPQLALLVTGSSSIITVILQLVRPTVDRTVTICKTLMEKRNAL